MHIRTYIQVWLHAYLYILHMYICMHVYGIDIYGINICICMYISGHSTLMSPCPGNTAGHELY